MAADEKPRTVALAGNPNCGKTALFNALTGARQRVGNWSGVTVERKSGKLQYEQQLIEVVDLPGIYSLTVASEIGSIDERIACEYLLSSSADVVVNVLDASNLERNLYLTLQLLEMQIPVVLAVNMMDIISQRGIELDVKQLGRLLGCPAVGLVANQGKGLEALKKEMIRAKTSKTHRALAWSLPEEIAQSVATLTSIINQSNVKSSSLDPQWLALRLLEEDAYAEQLAGPELVSQAAEQSQKLLQQFEESADILIADRRYGFINEVSSAVTHFIKTPHQTVTQFLDKIVLNRYLAVPIFLLVMYFMFLFAINVAGAFQDFFDLSSTTIFVNGVAHVLQQWHAPTWLIAILASGVGKGINTTITFAPVIGGMFLFLSFLEDSGYMARAAFVMDRLMRAIGLPGQSFVPMIVGFGCNVPAVMGARTLANRRDRILAIMMMPFMSCGARLAIFAVFASAFFPMHGAAIIFLLYLTGILAAVLTGLMLRKTVLPGQATPLVMELPPYHLPQWGSLLQNAWNRLKKFLFRAGRLIIPICILIGALNAITLTGRLVHDDNQHSLLSEVGKVVTPVFAPMGIHQDNWPATVGLATGVLAKEVVVGTLNTLYSEVGHLGQKQGDQFNLRRGLKAAAATVPANLAGLATAFVNPLVANESPHSVNQGVYGLMYQRFDGAVGAFAYLLFVLLYFPCISTMAVMRRELSQRWAYFSVVWNTGFAYGLAVMVYQLLTIARHPLASFAWVGGVLFIFALIIIVIRRTTKERRHLNIAAVEGVSR